MSTSPLKHKHTNRLINETSPYLLQHSHNPVDWYPWSEEAFERAKRDDKPIFLSIGYSTCHWCHVMERESFEDEHIAAVMNEHFINVKVDREQRPDIDAVYMNAVQTMTGSGGWPLSVFLTPDGRPFFGGTYFPPREMLGRSGFESVLLAVTDTWNSKHDELTDSAGKISEFLTGQATPAEKGRLSPDMLDGGFNHLRSIFDGDYGGFGTAPKFPQPTNLSMLLTYYHRTGRESAMQMVEKTLDEMARGGIYDHIGGGFHRYSTDARWLVPHFEKMLYDQALVARAYIQAWQLTAKPQYERIAREVFDYVLRDMTDPAGGFYSAEDADSEGREGAFYLWDPKQTASVLEQNDARIFNRCYGVTEEGNFEKGKTILSVTASIDELAGQFKKNSTEIINILVKARLKLFEERQKRVRPDRDDKVITAWNGLMISALAYGGASLNEQRYVKAAERAAEFILSTLHKNCRLMRFYRTGRVTEVGFLDDYAFMIFGLLDLFEASFDAGWLIAAEQLAEEMVRLFADERQGGFFLTGSDGDKLIVRTRGGYDGAVPSGNSVAALALLKLGRLTMNQDFTSRGTKTLEAFSRQLEQSGASLSAMLIALDFWFGPGQEIVIAGDSGSADTKGILELVRTRFLPNAVVLLHDPRHKNSALYQVVPFIRNQTAIGGKTTAYVCEDYVCKRAVGKTDDLAGILSHISKARK